jgi:hypothetical protein
MPTGIKINWPIYDQLLIDNVSKYNILEFTRKFLPHISPTAVAKRIKKLNLKPLKFEFNDEIRERVKNGVTSNYFDEKTDKLLLDNIKSMSIKELSRLTGYDKTAIWRRLKEINYIHDKNDVYNKHSIAVKLALSNPEVKRKLSVASKGKVLSEETKLKISQYMTGSGNHQYGKPRTKEENEKVSLKIHELMSLGKINNKCYINGWHQSSKSGNVHYRSSYELAYYKKLDADDNVINYKVEPLLIKYFYKNCLKYYKPDLLVNRNSGPTLEEIKPLIFVHCKRNQAKFKYASDYATRCNLEFKVITEKDIF